MIQHQLADGFLIWPLSSFRISSRTNQADVMPSILSELTFVLYTRQFAGMYDTSNVIFFFHHFRICNPSFFFNHFHAWIFAILEYEIDSFHTWIGVPPPWVWRNLARHFVSRGSFILRVTWYTVHIRYRTASRTTSTSYWTPASKSASTIGVRHVVVPAVFLLIVVWACVHVVWNKQNRRRSPTLYRYASLSVPRK